MRLCMPTLEVGARSARLSPHFGRAPFFIFVDSESGGMITVPNPDASHTHGRCRPIPDLEHQGVDAVVCLGLGRRAWEGLNERGIPVLLAAQRTVGEALSAFRDGDLSRVTSPEACHDHHGNPGDRKVVRDRGRAP
jgi:predicted Fe-Mo cluster-binding NifX family protein